jgi:hypothetical protein
MTEVWRNSHKVMNYFGLTQDFEKDYYDTQTDSDLRRYHSRATYIGKTKAGNIGIVLERDSDSNAEQ